MLFYALKSTPNVVMQKKNIGIAKVIERKRRNKFSLID